MAWDFDWIPNDVYGHIHDELWERLVYPPDSSPAAAVATGPGPGVAGPPHLDTSAIPWLIRWMGARPTRWDLVRHRLAGHLPDKLAKLMDPFPATRWGERHIRWHVAACEGFTLLGTNATTALPALSNLLSSTTNADLPLTSAIANTGPQGMAVLTNALTSTRATTGPKIGRRCPLKAQMAWAAPSRSLGAGVVERSAQPAARIQDVAKAKVIR